MSSVAPTVTSVTFDKTAYAPGDTITATVHYTPGASDSTVSFTGTATDQSNGQTGTMEGTFTVQINDATTVSVSDTGSRTWTKVSDDGAGVAVFTAKA